jgi:hypothetical protein
MSLINDALRRAQENQPNEPAAGPELRPVYEDHAEVRQAGLLLPIAISLVALLGLFGLWQVSRSSGKQDKIEARALAAPPEVSKAVSVPSKPPEKAPELAKPKPQPVSPAPAATAPASVTMQAAPAASDFKLQSIVFSRRPSAMISGLIVEPGDKIQGYVVSEIKADRVVLTGDGPTIVLTLP